jgi:hypothetical protein
MQLEIRHKEKVVKETWAIASYYNSLLLPPLSTGKKLAPFAAISVQIDSTNPLHHGRAYSFLPLSGYTGIPVNVQLSYSISLFARSTATLNSTLVAHHCIMHKINLTGLPNYSLNVWYLATSISLLMLSIWPAKSRSH